jgi:hypothetical protein
VAYLAQHITGDDVRLIDLNYRERKGLEELDFRLYLDRANPHGRAISTEKNRIKDPTNLADYLDTVQGE